MDFGKLSAYLNGVPELGAPACECIVMHRGKEVFHETVGESDPAAGKKACPGDTYWLYSATKPITCAAAMRLVEEGKLGLDDPVAKYLPEYAHLHRKTGEPCRNTLTIRHLFTMTGGLDYKLDAAPIVRAAAVEPSTRNIVRAFPECGLDFEPGTHFQYSLAHDVLGAVIEIVSGMRFGEYLKKMIFDPLEMADTGFEPTPERLQRMSEQYEYDEARVHRLIRGRSRNPYRLGNAYESGGAGLISTASDYIRFADMMCRKGLASNGYRLLKEETVDLMRKDQMAGHLFGDFTTAFARPGYSYGLGVRTLVDRMNGRIRSSLGEFGWDGAAGAFVLFDPAAELALVYMEHVVHHQAAYGEIHPAVRNLAYEGVFGIQ